MMRLLLISCAIPLLPAAFLMLRYKWYVGRQAPPRNNLPGMIGSGYILLFVGVFHFWLKAF
jgi:hypothetical protein